MAHFPASSGGSSWSADTEVTTANGKLYFSKTTDGLLKRVKYSLSTPTADTTYSNVIPNDYRPSQNMLIVGYENNGGLREGLLYTTGNFFVKANATAGFYGMTIYS